MSELIERIAQALWSNRYPGMGRSGPLWDLALSDADAVVAALGLVEEVSLGLGWRDDGITRRRFVTEWKPIIEECQCGADITHRDEHHRRSVCVRASGHSGAHDDGQGCVWTGGNQ